MDKTNSKILTLSFACTAALVGFTLHMILIALSGAWGFMARMVGTDLVRHFIPALVGIGIFAFLQLNKGIVKWGDEVVSELRKVVWPSRKDTTATTIIVVIMVMISSVIITSFDWLSGILFKYLIG